MNKMNKMNAVLLPKKMSGSDMEHEMEHSAAPPSRTFSSTSGARNLESKQKPPGVLWEKGVHVVDPGIQWIGCWFWGKTI